MSKKIKYARKKRSVLTKPTRWFHIGNMAGIAYKSKKRFERQYGLFAIKDGVICGYVEHSFSMGWSTERVSIMSLESAERDLKIVAKENNFGAEHFFIYRLSRKSKNAPIQVDFEARAKELIERHNAGESTKFEFRNAPFTYRPELDKKLQKQMEGSQLT